ncbi:MAG: hypothetical protein IKA36_00615 [Clostridia bacterium]|nr:hypothetical protein [Clostridia bacterium]
MEKKNKLEEELVMIKKEKEESDKRLLKFEIMFGIFSLAFMFVLILIAANLDMPTWLRVVLIVVGFAQFLAMMFVCIRIEQVAGHYECKLCHEKYVPTYKQTLLAMHIGWTRYMKCPHCSQKSWDKKVTD